MRTLKLHTNHLSNLASLSSSPVSFNTIQGGNDMEPCTLANLDGRYTQEQKNQTKRMRS